MLAYGGGVSGGARAGKLLCGLPAIGREDWVCATSVASGAAMHIAVHVCEHPISGARVSGFACSIPSSHMPVWYQGRGPVCGWTVHCSALKAKAWLLRRGSLLTSFCGRPAFTLSDLHE